MKFDKLDGPSLLDACTISLQLDKNKQLILICVYRPPQANITYLRNLCDFIVDKVKKIILMQYFAVLVILTY